MGDIEAALLTGGASSRMGTDKAKMVVGGQPIALRIASQLRSAGLQVTVLGREPIQGYGFIADEEDYAGPLAAISRLMPSAEWVFVASCDLPGFDPVVVDHLRERVGSADAAIPFVDERMQPLCALYRKHAFDVAGEIAASGERRIMRWIERLRVSVVEEIPRQWVANVNSPADLRAFLSKDAEP